MIWPIDQTLLSQSIHPKCHHFHHFLRLPPKRLFAKLSFFSSTSLLAFLLFLPSLGPLRLKPFLEPTPLPFRSFLTKSYSVFYPSRLASVWLTSVWSLGWPQREPGLNSKTFLNKSINTTDFYEVCSRQVLILVSRDEDFASWPDFSWRQQTS